MIARVVVVVVGKGAEGAEDEDAEVEVTEQEEDIVERVRQLSLETFATHMAGFQGCNSSKGGICCSILTSPINYPP